MVLNVSNFALSTPRKRISSDLKFTSPVGDDVTFELDEFVVTTWMREIEGNNWGVLALCHSGIGEVRQFMISQNLKGSSCAWSVPSDQMDADSIFVDGSLFWLVLIVYPDEFVASSVYLTLRSPTDDSVSTTTTSATQPPTPTSTSGGQMVTSIIPVTSIIYQTVTPVDSSQPTGLQQDDYWGPSYSDTQTLSPGAKAGVAIRGGVLGISHLVLFGFFIYRRRRSSSRYREPGGDHDTAVEGLPEQQANTGEVDTAALPPKEHISGVTSEVGPSGANGSLHEME